MDSSEKIQPVKGGGSDRTAVPTVFAGTVTGVKKENGEQSLEVQYSQGKLRFQADGDFQVGEKVRLTFPGNGSVQVEKGPAATGQWDAGAGYTLPQNMSTLKDLRAFEDNVSQWIAAKNAPGAPAGAKQAQEMQALKNSSMPQLLLQAMGEDGGKEFLEMNLPALHRGVVSALMDAVQESVGDTGAKVSLLDLLKTLGKSGAGSGAGAGSAAGQAGAKAAGAEAPMLGQGGAGEPWFGRIMDKQRADDFMTPMQRLQYGGTGGAPKNDPNYKYTIDMGGRTMEVFSSQSLEAGSFADFELQRQGGRVQARFTDPVASLPAGLKTAMAGASPELRQGMVLASRYLNDFQGEPYYGKLVEEFGGVLAQSGVINARSVHGQPEIPERKDLDALLKLFVAYPRDMEHPERQAKVWGDALKDPQALMRLLKTLRPEQEASLLRSGTDLRLAGDGNAALEAEVGKGEGAPATGAWLKKMLPEAFRSEDLLKLAADGSPLTQAGKDQDPAKFLLQAVANGLPREEQIPEGKPTQFYFYQGQEWRNLQVTWQREGGGQGRGKAGPKAPLQVRVETKAKNMGQVNVAVSWEPKGAKLDFRNQHHDVRDLLAKSLPELEKSLSLLDFKVTSWSYQLLPNDAPTQADPGWTRPASLSDGANLDLIG